MRASHGWTYLDSSQRGTRVGVSLLRSRFRVAYMQLAAARLALDRYRASNVNRGSTPTYGEITKPLLRKPASAEVQGFQVKWPSAETGKNDEPPDALGARGVSGWRLAGYTDLRRADHWSALRTRTTSSGSLESRTARPPFGRAAISTQFVDCPPEYEDLIHLRSLIARTPYRCYELCRLLGRECRSTDQVEVRNCRQNLVFSFCHSAR